MKLLMQEQCGSATNRDVRVRFEHYRRGKSTAKVDARVRANASEESVVDENAFMTNKRTKTFRRIGMAKEKSVDAIVDCDRRCSRRIVRPQRSRGRDVVGLSDNCDGIRCHHLLRDQLPTSCAHQQKTESSRRTEQRSHSVIEGMSSKLMPVT